MRLAAGLAAATVVGGGAALAALVAQTLAPGVPADAAPRAPRFVEEAATAGVEHVYDGGSPFFVGGGVAVFDCNGDGRQELYLAGGERPAALFRNDSPPGGALRFTPLHDPATDVDRATGAYPLDIEGDGEPDLVVLGLGEDVILRGLGDCRFERANESLGLAGRNDWTVAFSATWEGEAAWPTLAFGSYLALDAAGEPLDTCAASRLIRPRAEGPAYTDETALEPGFCTLSMLFSDWDRSERRDLRLSNDRHYARDAQEQLWRMEAGRPPRAYTAADGWQTMRIWGMGIAAHDITGDGLPEYYLTSQGDNKLQSLTDGPAEPRYGDIALRRGATAHEPFTGDTDLPSTAWHPQFDDVNNDGWTDLYVSKGNVDAMPDYAARDPSNLLLGRRDGTFVEAADEAGIVDFSRARGAALADLNLDGLLDIVEVNRETKVELWRNVGSGTADAPEPMGGWLGVRLVDNDRTNRDAIGAWLEVRVGDRVITREVTVGGGHAGGQLGWMHVGLGAASEAEVRVLWPDGQAGAWLAVQPNRFVSVSREGLQVVDPTTAP